MTAVQVPTGAQRSLHTFVCMDCGSTYPTYATEGNVQLSYGYGMDALQRKLCYACCAKNDIHQIRCGQDMWMYLTLEQGMVSYSPRCKVANWPGSLSFRATVRKGSHNIARWQYSVWVNMPDGFVWYGRQYGNNTQLVRLQRTRGVWSGERASTREWESFGEKFPVIRVMKPF